MIRISTAPGKLLGLATLLLVAASTSWAATVFDNTSTNRSQVFPVATYTVGGSSVTVTEIGDQVTLSGSDRRITDMLVGYALTSANTNRNETATLNIYKDNASGVPATLLFSSAPVTLTLAPNGAEAIFQGISADLQGANTVTWMLNFGDVDAGETLGLVLFGNPTIGVSFDDIWVRAGGTFELKNIPGAFQPEAFYARIIAVPEPNTLALLVLGGVACLGFRQLLRRRPA